MRLTPLYDTTQGQMRIAGLMSGSGSNLRKIIETEKTLAQENGTSPYHVAVIFSDRFDSKAVEIGRDHDIPVVVRDLGAYCKARGKQRRDLELRAEYDQETVNALSPYGISVAAFAGYMSIATAPLISAYLGINVHPADLSILTGGKRKFIGDNAVFDALYAGERELRSTTHIVQGQVDQGRILMISAPLVVGDDVQEAAGTPALNALASAYQDRLKEIGDWQIFPATLRCIAEGRFARDNDGNLHFDETLIPQGLRLVSRPINLETLIY